LNETENKVMAILSEISPLGRDIGSDDELTAIGIDSLKVVNLIVAIEDGLGIHFSDSDLDPSKLVRVEDVFRLIKPYLG